jgi:hypothetical protein
VGRISGRRTFGGEPRDCTLVEHEASGADLTGCRVYGVSAWCLKLERAKQHNLIITGWDEPEIMVDDLEVVQLVLPSMWLEFARRDLQNLKLSDQAARSIG